MEAHGKLKASYLSLKRAATHNRLFDYWWLLEQEVNSWTNWVRVPVRRRLWLLQHGFTSPFDEIYDFETYGPESYLSELQRYRLYRALNGRHRYLLDDKLSQHWMLADYPENRPTAYGYVDRGSVHGLSGTEFEGDPVPVSAWFPETLREHSPLVVKKLRGKGGKQVVVCEYDAEDDRYVLDNDTVSRETLCEEIGRLSGYLVTEYVTQHEYADELYPHAANSIRILTLWDDVNEELHTPIAVQRIGTDRSRPVDNCSVGGLTAEIDLETGELGEAAQYPFWRDGGVPWYAEHPDTGAQIEGTTVPRWDSVRSTIEEIARTNTNIPAIGWDVLLDESGEPVVIEANTGTAIRTLQIHRPLLEDPRVAAIASRYLESVDGTVPAR